jgi:tRNA-2-methylthio-N6-dimethylallyladenosine synthase
MNRPYTKAEFLKTVHYFRDTVPGGALSTDIIVGFPGETEEDFKQTLEVVKECAFDSAFTFQYSPRPGTKAAVMEDQIPHDVVTERFGRLLELQNDLAFKSNQAKVGKTEEILILPQSRKPVSVEETRRRYCSQCGKKVNPKDKFCSNCGARLN